MRKITEREVESFRQDLVNEERASTTIEKYLHDIRVFADWLGTRELDKGLVLEYKAALAKKSKRQVLIRSYLRLTASFPALSGTIFVSKRSKYKSRFSLPPKEN